MGILDRANQTPVPPQLLVEAMALFAEMPPAERKVFDARTVRLADFLAVKGFSGKQHADLVAAITCRWFAIARLVRGEGEDPTCLHADVIRAAADEALVEAPGGDVAFDARSFAGRILHLAQPQGRA